MAAQVKVSAGKKESKTRDKTIRGRLSARRCWPASDSVSGWQIFSKGASRVIMASGGVSIFDLS